MAESKPEQKGFLSEKDVKAPHHHHHKETHGKSDDIDENTPIDEIKAPGVFERAKEEIEALVEAIHPKKKESENHDSSSKKEGGFFASIGRNFEKICSPRDKKRS
ncbi:hypothetical protein BVC80_1717g2 [Macleaya cordata]|uniref:Uncharacterized protein n=1 Tax=Macleaya cordata TaxID=56857 RepID=A0A200Q1V0_MACCD|nr:hypothetical protein BVC80_1717g2 [Macleaya cordata]